MLRAVAAEIAVLFRLFLTRSAHAHAHTRTHTHMIGTGRELLTTYEPALQAACCPLHSVSIEIPAENGPCSYLSDKQRQSAARKCCFP